MDIDSDKDTSPLTVRDIVLLLNTQINTYWLRFSAMLIVNSMIMNATISRANSSLMLDIGGLIFTAFWFVMEMRSRAHVNLWERKLQKIVPPGYEIKPSEYDYICSTYSLRKIRIRFLLPCLILTFAITYLLLTGNALIR